MSLRSRILHWSIPITKVVGKIGLWWVKRRVTSSDVAAFTSLLRPGDALLSAIEWELSNLFIEGFWSHQAIYAGDGIVIEAVGTGVNQLSLADFMLKKDHVAAYRPRFATAFEGIQAVQWCKARVGLPYDFYFEWQMTDNNAFYCAELYGAAYMAILGPACPFLARKVMGEITFVPQDVANAHEKFALIIQT